MNGLSKKTTPHPLNPSRWDRTVFATEAGEVLYVEITLRADPDPDLEVALESDPNGPNPGSIEARSVLVQA